EHVHVQGESHFGQLAALRLAEVLTGAADLQVMGGQHEARTDFLHRLDGLQAPLRILGQGLQRRHHQVREGAVVRAADATTQLVQLRQSQPVGLVDQDGVGGRHVDAALDDGGAQQDVEAAMVEVDHQLFQFALARSEEHTSELQSRENLVCRLLLEKKKNCRTDKP